MEQLSRVPRACPAAGVPGDGARLAPDRPDGGTPETYRRFVEAGIEEVDTGFLEDKDRSQLCLGSQAFRAKIQALYQNLRAGRKRADDIFFRRHGTWRGAEEILGIVCRHLGVDRAALQRRRRDSFDRAIAARMLCDHGGLTQRQIASLLSIGSAGAVGKQLQRLATGLARDDRLRRQVAAITAECRPQPS